MGKTGKNYTASIEKVEPEKLYAPQEAIDLALEIAFAKFDESVEVHLRMGVDPRKADQQVRGSVILPHGTGSTVKVAVFAKGEKAKEAEDAGADVVGAEDLAEKVEGGWLEFDATIATPDMMGVVGKLGKTLGPRGLMPNPKAGTVTFEVAKAVEDLKKGKIEYRLDKNGIIHLIIGKVSFGKQKLIDNYFTLLEEIIRAKPAASKGKYIKNISLSTTMGPGIKIDPAVTS